MWIKIPQFNVPTKLYHQLLPEAFSIAQELKERSANWQDAHEERLCLLVTFANIWMFFPDLRAWYQLYRYRIENSWN